MRTVRRLIVLVLLLACPPAAAHQTNLSTGHLVVDGTEVRYRLTVSAHDLALILDIPTDLVQPIPMESFAGRLDLLREYLDEKLLVVADDMACPRASVGLEYQRLPEEIVIDLRYRCPAPATRLRVAYRLFFGLDPGHRAIGTIDAGRGREEYVVDRAASDIVVDFSGGNALIAFGRTVWLGVEHILIGVDHVLFVVALLLGGGRLRRVVLIVTAFTLAHSLTLALAWFGLVDLPVRLVEGLIAASVAYVALENVLGRGTRHRWLLAFGFGLVHGLGFYNALSGLDLDPRHAVRTLFAFNLGVELGQLAIVAVMFPLLARVMGRPWFRRVALSGSLAILAVALFWLVERAVPT